MSSYQKVLYQPEAARTTICNLHKKTRKFIFMQNLPVVFSGRFWYTYFCFKIYGFISSRCLPLQLCRQLPQIRGALQQSDCADFILQGVKSYVKSSADGFQVFSVLLVPHFSHPVIQPVNLFYKCKIGIQL